MFEPQQLDSGNKINLGLFAFLGVCLLSFWPAMSNETSIAGWIRGLIPFSLLFTHTLIASARSLDDIESVLNAIQIGCLAWAFKVLIVGGSSVLDVFTGSLGRLTYEVPDTLVPYGLVGLTLALFNPSSFAKKWRVAQVLLFLLLIIACVYRSQLILAFALILFRLYRWSPKRVSIMMTVAVLAFALIPIGISVSRRSGSLVDSVGVRVDDAIESGLGGRRSLEAEYALETFHGSPLLGAGLGYEVPISYIEYRNEIAWLEGNTVTYIHNVWMYLLMDLGLAGLVTYGLFTITPVVRGFMARSDRSEWGELRLCIGVSMGTILIFSTCQACFRSVQLNLVIALLVGLSCAASRRRIPTRA